MGNIFPQVVTLKEKPSLFRKALNLIERSFHYPPERSFKIDFAPLMDESNHHNCFVLIDENENVLAHVGVKERTLRIKNRSHNFCMIGGIAVDEKHRGKGFFQLLFTDVMAEKRSDAGFFLLWSDQEKLYSKFGFSLCGGQYELSKTNTDHRLRKVHFSSLNRRQQDDIRELYESSFQCTYLSTARSELDWELISKVTSADLFIEENNGKIISYMFANKGQDLEGIVYEYGASLELISYIEKARSIGKVWMGAPFISSDQEHYQFLMCPGDTRLFADFIWDYTEGQMKVRDINVMKREVFFDFGGETLVLTVEEFLRGVMGPGPFEELGDLKPFYLSGLDSI